MGDLGPNPDRWDGSYLWWPEQSFLITSQYFPARDDTQTPRYCHPTRLMFMANYALVALNRFFEGEQDFFDPYYWPRRFRVVKNRYDGRVGTHHMMTLLDFKLSMIV